MSDITEIPSQVQGNLETAESIIDNASQLIDYMKDANAGEATISDAENLL
jgi:hypothetical protein